MSSPLVAMTLACAGCSTCGAKQEEPISSTPDASGAIAATRPVATAPVGTPAPRDSAGHLVPRTSAPEGGTLLPIPQGDPSWELDPADTAKDYVARYVRATRRYGDRTACVTIGASQPASSGKRSVEVRDDGSTPCTSAVPQPSEPVRDVFIVDVPADRLSVDDSSKRDPLQRWPDGSDPEGPATTPVQSADNMKVWHAQLKDALRGLQLVPIRTQAYGRGTYLIVTLAGWRDPLARLGSDEALRATAEKLCAANGGQAFGMFAALDRTLLLRVRCGLTPLTRWDRF